MRVIVCGLGHVGYRVTMLLMRLGEDVTVVTFDSREEFSELAIEAGCKIIYGDARNERNLREAGIADASALIICADDDVANIEIALDARRLNPAARVIVRVFDQVLARRLEEFNGIHRALSMSAISAPVFADAALGESVRGALFVDNESFVVGRIEQAMMDTTGANVDHLKIHHDKQGERFEVLCRQADFALLAGRPQFKPISRAQVAWRGLLAAADPRSIGRTIGEVWKNAPMPLKGVAAAIALLSVISVFVFQYGMHLSPLNSVYFVITTVTTTGYGDITPMNAAPWLKVYGCLLMLLGSASVATLYSIITDFIVSVRFDQMFGRARVASNEHVIVVGLGNVGFRTVNELRRLNLQAVAIDLKPDAEFRAFVGRDVPFVVGDARDQETLRRAGLDKATAVLALTDNDAVNLSVGLMAKSLRPEARSVVRLFNAQFAMKVTGAMEVDSALSPAQIAAPSFVGAALYDDAVFCYVDGDRFIAVRQRRDVAEPADAGRHLWWEVNHPTRGTQTIAVSTRELQPERTIW